MQLPIIRCSKCGFEFSVEAKEDMTMGRRWLEISPGHVCRMEVEDRDGFTEDNK